jgi:hypothetical protein
MAASETERAPRLGAMVVLITATVDAGSQTSYAVTYWAAQ